MSNTSSSYEMSVSLRLTAAGGSLMIAGGWFDILLMYNGVSFGLRKGSTYRCQSPAYDFSVKRSRKLFFLCPFRTVLNAIHVRMQVTY